MSKKIRKVAVLGSGIMGSGIAAQLANVGLEVLLLDIVPFDLTDEQKKVPALRNKMVNDSLKKAIKSKPAAFYRKGFESRVTTGNFDDDFEKISDCDWIIEVVVERLDIKKIIFDKVEKYRKAGSLVTSNTSGIPIHMMAEDRSEDFKKNFCGTHFFNPPRYMRLLEIIPTTDTDQSVVDFFMKYGDLYLGKQTVLAKDTPAFIANRVGMYALGKIYELTQELDLTAEEVDKLTGPAIGRPKMGTFRLGDLVGHDTSAKVSQGLLDNCPEDTMVQGLKTPDFMKFIVDNKFYGDKVGQGFYKKTKEKDAKGRRITLALDLKTLEYRPKQRPSLPSLSKTKDVDSLKKRVEIFFKEEGKGAELVKQSLGGLFAYVSKRVPQISDNTYSIDDAMKTGYNWGAGPFEYWDMIGIEAGIAQAEAQGETVAQWVKDMLAAGHTSFYKVEDHARKFYDVESQSYVAIPGAEEFVILDTLRGKTPVLKNEESVLHDIGDGVLCFEFRSKANAIGEGILRGLNEAIEIAEEQGWKGLVIGNNSDNFAVGANIMMIGMMASQKQWDQLDEAVKVFQNTSMRLRYSSIPVVIATQGYVFGGGCEFAMHADKVCASSESYIGLVEAGIGLLPGGGGTKEFALRASDSFFEGDVMMPSLIKRFQTIAAVEVATSAHEAFDKGFLQQGFDEVVYNKDRAIAEAKRSVLEMSHNYSQPAPRNDIHVLGRAGLGTLYTAANSLLRAKYASEHDIKIAKKIAYVLCGGDLTAPQQVSEQYLLDIEREAFISLAGEPKTLERIQHMLMTNRPLRN